MSKTRGNVIDPLDVIDRFGTDAFRFTLVALAAQGGTSGCPTTGSRDTATS